MCRSRLPGYLYFPLATKEKAKYELQYSGPDAVSTLALNDKSQDRFTPNFVRGTPLIPASGMSRSVISELIEAIAR